MNNNSVFEDRAKDLVSKMTIAEKLSQMLYEAPEIKTAVSRYNLLSGGGCIPPLWGLGIWYRGFSKFSKNDVLRLAEKLRIENSGGLTYNKTENENGIANSKLNNVGLYVTDSSFYVNMQPQINESYMHSPAGKQVLSNSGTWLSIL